MHLKKFLLSLGSVAVVSTSASAVVSCNVNLFHDNGSNYNKDGNFYQFRRGEYPNGTRLFATGKIILQNDYTTIDELKNDFTLFASHEDAEQVDQATMSKLEIDYSFEEKAELKKGDEISVIISFKPYVIGTGNSILGSDYTTWYVGLRYKDHPTITSVVWKNEDYTEKKSIYVLTEVAGDGSGAEKNTFIVK